MPRVDTPCPTCNATGLIPLDEKARQCLAKGLKAGTCGDWVECTDCKRGTFTMYEEAIVPATIIAVDGFRSW